MDTTIERYIREGDHRRALAGIAETHAPALGRFLAATLGSREDAEEALQDTLLEALNTMKSYRGDRGLRPWLFGIARHVAASRARVGLRRRSLWARFFASEEVSHPTNQVDARLTMAGAITRLSPNLRDALLLRYQLGLDATEVADTLGISHDAARKRISQALAHLRSDLAEPLEVPAPTLSESSS
jgi:RNA polymerase sigma-70 factor (ECF subfamily)